jgi:SAM-dependent methyltransferase
MPTIEWNQQRWGQEHNWSGHGDEWSYAFGSAAAHWYAFLLPRLYRFLPDPAAADSHIVEIAPGHGRWTQFLLGHCRQLSGYDVTQGCVDYCRSRFKARADDGSAVFERNDGLHLPVADTSVDFVFSYDSLVRVERDVMQSYLAEIARCLKPGRFAFLQHSNLGEFPALHNHQNIGPFNSRGASVSSGTVQADAIACGLHVLLQEGLNHETQHLKNELVDCISVIRRPARPGPPPRTVRLGNTYYPALGQLTKTFVLPYEQCDVT